MEYQKLKQIEELEKKNAADKEKNRIEREKLKVLKDQEKKKKQIADYKRKKLEAEEMIANADLDYDDDEAVKFKLPVPNPYLNSSAKLNSKDSFAKSLGLGSAIEQGGNKGQETDEEDRYLDEIINRNYISGKAPPAVN